MRESCLSSERKRINDGNTLPRTTQVSHSSLPLRNHYSFADLERPHDDESKDRRQEFKTPLLPFLCKLLVEMTIDARTMVHSVVGN